ncbi:MAG: alpha/beta fold hydrolase [Minwuia sp.]|nr:alpha/beta fold hydrolase [Minwuia sp.]
MTRQDLLLIPGLLCTRQLWEPQIEALADRARIAVADHTRDDTIAAIARRILDTAPATFALAGLSMGGYIAFEIWRQAPERVERIALMDTRASKDTDAETIRRKDLLALVDQGRFNGIHDRLIPLFVHADRLDDDALLGSIRQMAEDTGKDGFVRQTRALMARQSAHDVCQSIDVPALALCGRQDALTPLEMHEEMADLIPGARLAVIEDCGHLSTLEKPEAVTAEMRTWMDA